MLGFLWNFRNLKSWETLNSCMTWCTTIVPLLQQLHWHEISRNPFFVILNWIFFIISYSINKFALNSVFALSFNLLFFILHNLLDLFCICLHFLVVFKYCKVSKSLNLSKNCTSPSLLFVLTWLLLIRCLWLFFVDLSHQIHENVVDVDFCFGRRFQEGAVSPVSGQHLTLVAAHLSLFFEIAFVADQDYGWGRKVVESLEISGNFVQK